MTKPPPAEIPADAITLTPARLDFVYSPTDETLDERVAIVIEDHKLGTLVLPLTVVGARAVANRLWELTTAVPHLRAECARPKATDDE